MRITTDADTHELLKACQLGIMMLIVEARAHRENQAPKKAEAVEGAIRRMQAAIDAANGSDQ